MEAVMPSAPQKTASSTANKKLKTTTSKKHRN
jgi:hypothetical protein